MVSALHGLFRAFQEQQQEEEEERRQQERPLASAGSSGSLHASSVPPSPARPAPVKAAPGTASARHMPGMPAPPSPQQAPPDGAPGRGRAAVDPSALRVALGNLEGYNFGVGEPGILMPAPALLPPLGLGPGLPPLEAVQCLYPPAAFMATSVHLFLLCRRDA